MIGNLVAKIRREKNISKTELSRKANINIGHLTHIEKNERNPSHKVLKALCLALGIPYQQLFHAYDKTLTEEQLELGYLDYIPYNQIPAISKIDKYIDCPADCSGASFAYKIPDDSMAPLFKKDNYAFVEINAPIENKAIGLFRFENEYLIRRLLYKKDYLVLKADNKNFKDITIGYRDDFQIIGRIYI